MNFGLDAMNIHPDYASDQPNMSGNSRSIFGGGSADKSQSGNPQQMMTVSNLTPNSGTSTLQTSGHILSPVPKFVSNPAPQTSQSRTTMDLLQFTNQNQRLKQHVFEHKAVQRPPTHPSIAQSTIMFGHQNNKQQMPFDHLRPCPWPVSTIQTSHLQNQQTLRQQISNTGQLQQRQHQVVQPSKNFQQNLNQTLLQFQQRTPQEHGQRNISAALSAPVKFSHPNEFSSNETWREYAFRQVLLMKENYLNELLKMRKNAMHLYSQERNMEIAKKYENAKEFLEKMIAFLNIPRVDMIPKNNERVYNYMNFIVNYLTSFRNKNGGFSQNFNQIINQQPVYQPPDTQSKYI
ncbi:hypothetical protein Lser_V15G38759 [Lactuca serriola]